MDAAATPDLPGAVSLCLLGGCRWEQTLPRAAISECPQPTDPHGEGAQDMVQKPLLDRRVQLTAARGHGSSQGRNPALPQTTAVPRGDTASAQALPPGAASAKDLTETRLELHQVSALSPQLQARMSLTLLDSLLQVGALNTRREITTRDQGQQQQ